MKGVRAEGERALPSKAPRCLQVCASVYRFTTRALVAGLILALLTVSPLFQRNDGGPAAVDAAHPRIGGGASGASLRGSEPAGVRPGARPLLGIAPPPLALPPICVVKPGYHAWRDRDCYLQMEALHLKELDDSPEAPYCWGSSGADAALFHTVSLTALPTATPLLVDSFLATQCCDAVLNVWVAADVLAAATAAGDVPPVPPGQAGRVLFRPLDVDALWDSVREDFPDVNDTAASAMKDFADVRFRANWARILLLYKYGGVYVDLDTMFLRDFRPLLSLPTPAFTYRQGSEIIMNIAVLRLPPRPDVRTRDVIATAARTHAVSQSRLSLIMKPWASESPWASALSYVSASLHDMLWMSFLASQYARTYPDRPLAADVTPPELLERIRSHGAAFTPGNTWDAFFTALSPSELAAAEGGAPFFAGSFSYHWHNRYGEGIPPGTWAGVMHDRFQRLVAAKVCRA